MFSFVMLGYSLKKKDFFTNFWTINIYAVGGTIVSTFVVGYLLHLVSITTGFLSAAENPLEALMFGALISAVGKFDNVHTFQL